MGGKTGVEKASKGVKWRIPKVENTSAKDRRHGPAPKQAHEDQLGGGQMWASGSSDHKKE